MTTTEILNRANNAKTKLAQLDTETKNKALLAMADSLIENTNDILLANKKDVENAKGVLSDVMIDRLLLNEKRIQAMADGIREVTKLQDPIGKVLQEKVLSSGLQLKKISVPIGVVAMIYESRPNVTSDASALAFKSGNVCVLRGGKEAYNSNKAIVIALKKALKELDLDEDFINIIDDTSRNSASELMNAKGLVDLLIPRGSANLIKACVENSKVPYLETGSGICTIYVDESADLDMAIEIVNNAKTSRPSVCNAQETLLVNSKIANEFLKKLKQKLVDERIKDGKQQVELRLCEKSLAIIEGKVAIDEDYDTEFLDYILAVKIVDDVKQAVEHINKHSTHHSESVVSNNDDNINYFLNNIDSAALYVNASTRFTDGGEFGLGCEIGIATQKLHARGPVGLQELTSYKYILKGNGNIR